MDIQPIKPAPITVALASDLLRGADQIAEFIYGDALERRKIYHLAETSRLPVFRLGAVICARKSVLIAWIIEQEARGVHGLDGATARFSNK